MNDTVRPYVADFTKSGKEMLIDLLNWSNAEGMTTLFTPDTIFFTRPSKLNEEGLNTSINIARAIGFHIPQDTQEIKYNRLDINQVADGLGFGRIILVDTNKEYKSTHDLLDQLYEVFKVKLLPEDVIDEPIDVVFKPNTNTEDMVDAYKQINYPKITLRIADDSIAYLGKLTITLQPKPINIKTTIKQRVFRKSFMPPYPWGLG